MILPKMIGQRSDFEAHGNWFNVRKHRVNLYSLNVSRPDAPRNRWGTAEQIEADIAFVYLNGRLPPAKGERW